MRSPTEILEILKSVGAILTDSHFVGTSGRHMSVYVNKDALYPHTKETSAVCEAMAARHAGLEVDTVASPVLGGVILSQWVAHHLSRLKGKEVLAVYAEKTLEGGLVFTRGYDTFIKGKKVLVVEDTVATGGSLKKILDTVKSAGGIIVAAMVMVNRVPDEINTGTLGVPFSALVELPTPTYGAAECPLCKQGVPVNTAVGHGKKFLAAQSSNGNN
ncbi:MAG: phosphoribosyltransferase [Candidatus Liptonbacteria bacterium]|nr:phosphoribosyltransferase [Candidatus Liptonbacteria bacterium]